MSQQKFPPGWDEDRAGDVLAHYDSQNEDEQFAEIEAATKAEGTTMMAVPTELAPEVRALIARNVEPPISLHSGHSSVRPQRPRGWIQERNAAWHTSSQRVHR